MSFSYYFMRASSLQDWQAYVCRCWFIGASVRWNRRRVLVCRVFALLDYTSLMFLCGRRSAASFLGSRLKSQGADHVVVKVTALPAAAPNAALRKEVDAIGEKQTDALHRLFKQVNALYMCSFVLLSCVPLRGQCGSDG